MSVPAAMSSIRARRPSRSIPRVSDPAAERPGTGRLRDRDAEEPRAGLHVPHAEARDPQSSRRRLAGHLEWSHDRGATSHEDHGVSPGADLQVRRAVVVEPPLEFEVTDRRAADEADPDAGRTAPARRKQSEVSGIAVSGAAGWPPASATTMSTSRPGLTRWPSALRPLPAASVAAMVAAVSG